MDRYDVTEPQRFAEMVRAAEAGVEIEITRDGAVVARLVPAPATGGKAFVHRLRQHWQLLPLELIGGDGASEVRAMRDEGDH